jgi:hypothetical protein
VDPNSLNLNSHGKFMSAAIQFPVFIDPLDLDLSTVQLDSTVYADTTQSALTDKNEDGILEHEVKFLRAEVFEVIAEGQQVPITISGIIDGQSFVATDTIRVFRPHIKAPLAGAVVPSGVAADIEWIPIQDGPADHMDIFWSADDGATWDTVVVGTEDDSLYTWLVPEGVQSTDCMLMLAAVDSKDKVMGIGITNGTFTIGEAVIGLDPTIPLRFALLPAAPNPFLGSTKVRFDLPEAAPVKFRLFAIDGSLVRTLANGELYPAGRHELAWDGRNDRGQRTGAGVYFMKIVAGDNQAVRKIVRVSR